MAESEHPSDADVRVEQPPLSLIPPMDSLRPPAPSTDSLVPPAGSIAPPALDGEVAPVSLRRTLPPLPEVQPILDAAAELRKNKEWEAAIETYKKALFVVPQEAVLTQASIYAWVAEVKAAQGKPREAETNFEKALVIHPNHMRSLGGLIALAIEEKDWTRLAHARRRRADVLEDPNAKATELCAVADVELSRLKNPEKAIATLEIASVHRPDDLVILERLRDLYTSQRLWTKLVALLDDFVRLTSDPRERASLRFTQADLSLGRVRSEPSGLAFLEMALDEDPQFDRALSALVAVRTRREEWLELGTVYERLIERHAGAGDRDRAWEICRKLGTLRRDRLLDGPGALEALRGAVELRPDDAESRAAVAELLAAKGERVAAVAELENVTRVAPLRAHTYRRLFDLHQRAGRSDRAWLAATCLEELGASDVAQELVIEQFRPEGPIRPTRGLEIAWWDELLVADGADPIVDEILLVIGDAAAKLKLEDLEAQKKLPLLDPTRKQDRASTASVVRTFVWGARALGVPLPDLYAMPQVPTNVAAVPAIVPSTVLGQHVTTGRTVQQLAFIAGRHLTYYRPVYYPLVFFPTLGELSELVLSAVRSVIPQISLPPPPDGTPRIGDRLTARLTPAEKSQLSAVVGRLDARGGKLDLFAWIRAVELTATRVGLLLAGDLRTAMRLMNEEKRVIGELSSEAKRADLLQYCASERYATLRERMGVVAAKAGGQ